MWRESAASDGLLERWDWWVPLAFIWLRAILGGQCLIPDCSWVTCIVRSTRFKSLWVSPAFPVCAWVKVWVKEKAKKGRVVENPGVDVPGGLVVKTPHFHCRGPGSIPGRGSSACRAGRPKQQTEQQQQHNPLGVTAQGRGRTGLCYTLWYQLAWNANWGVWASSKWDSGLVTLSPWPVKAGACDRVFWPWEGLGCARSPLCPAQRVGADSDSAGTVVLLSGGKAGQVRA